MRIKSTFSFQLDGRCCFPTHTFLQQPNSLVLTKEELLQCCFITIWLYWTMLVQVKNVNSDQIIFIFLPFFLGKFTTSTNQQTLSTAGFPCFSTTRSSVRYDFPLVTYHQLCPSALQRCGPLQPLSFCGIITRLWQLQKPPLYCGIAFLLQRCTLSYQSPCSPFRHVSCLYQAVSKREFTDPKMRLNFPLELQTKFSAKKAERS